MMSSTQFYRSNKNSPAVRYLCFGASKEQAQKNILMVVGRNEWIEKYESFIAKFESSETIRFVMVEHRCQGKSEGIPAHVKNYRQYTQDLEKIAAIAMKGCSYSIMAHSMGALIVLLALASHQITPQKVLLLSPLLRLPDEHMPRWLLFCICFVMVKLGLGRSRIPTDKHQKITFENNKLTHDNEHYLKVTQSTIRQRFTTFAWLYATSRALHHIFKRKKIEKINSPIHIIVGGDERVVDPSGFADWVERASRYIKQDIVFERIDGARHELLAESSPYKEAVYQKLDKWLS